MLAYSISKPLNTTIETPGRICLFGEHQDYLGLPVIAAAISRTVQISGNKRNDNQVIIHKPNINQVEKFELKKPLIYAQKRDYFKSGINVLRKIGFEFSTGFEVEIQGNIPINSGTSSSSALLVSWIHFLVLNADNPKEISKKEIGTLAYQAEVLEFGEPGGMMDQYATAIGNLMYLESVPKIHIEELKPTLGTFVLGDSLQAKDTLGILAWVKGGMLEIIKKVSAHDATFNIYQTSIEKASNYKTLLSADEMALLTANLSDRDILRTAKKLFENNDFSQQQIGNLLNKHQDSLRDAKKVSTPKIDKMIENALNAGAFGAKINGSGGGGCMFAYAPENPESVAEAIERAGGKSYVINVAEGTRRLICL